MLEHAPSANTAKADAAARTLVVRREVIGHSWVVLLMETVVRFTLPHPNGESHSTGWPHPLLITERIETLTTGCRFWKTI